MPVEPESSGALPPPTQPRKGWLLVLVGLAGLTVLAGGTSAVLARFGRPLLASSFVVASQIDEVKSDEAWRRRAARAAQHIRAVQPRGVYLVIDSYRNRLQVIRDGEPLRTAICSTGTGVVLRDPRNGSEWVFDTPLGERIIENKRRNPVWAKPDWAFIEEGEMPPTDPNERFDAFSLGDFGLYMGDGYIIHGTLFKSLLGRRVTHGCIRLGDEDLEYVYRNARIGTRVYLY